MKATITSTDQIVSVSKDGKVKARVWEGLSSGGVPFTAYITECQVHKSHDQTEFVRELREHQQPSPDTLMAIDARMVL